LLRPTAGIEPNGLQRTLSTAPLKTDRLHDMENTRCGKFAV